MQDSELVERIYDHLENGDIDKAVMACLRLSRKANDALQAVLFLREFSPDMSQLSNVFYNETQKLNDEGRETLWEIAYERWIKGRTVDYIGKEDGVKADDTRNILIFGIGQIDPEIQQMEGLISDLILPNGMGEYDTAAFTDRYIIKKENIRIKITALNTIKERIKIRCLNYAIKMEKQIENQRNPREFIISAQNDVNNYFKQHSEDVYKKLQKSSQLIGSSNVEDISLLLTSIRRTLKSVADHFYPSIDEMVKCSDGEERKLGPDQYLNRLQEYIGANFKKSTSTDLMKSELEYLSVFFRRLNELTSKGVHHEASFDEARQCFIGIYMFLFNLISKIQVKGS